MSRTRQAPPVPRRERHAMGLLNSYLSWGHGPVNYRLREGMPLRSKERALVEHVTSLMSAFAPDQVSERNPLWRGVRLPTAWIEAGEWYDPAFVSTSTSDRVAYNFADPACAHDEFMPDPARRACLLKIVEAEGLHLDVTAILERLATALKHVTPSALEREVILPPNMHFVVLDSYPQLRGPWPARYAPLLLTVAVEHDAS